MTCYILARATANPPWVKGAIVDIFDGSKDFSNYDPLPSFILITITDRDKSDIQDKADAWRTSFTLTELSSNELGFRTEIAVPQRIIVETRRVTVEASYGVSDKEVEKIDFDLFNSLGIV